MTNEELDELRHSRTICKTRLTKFKTFLDRLFAKQEIEAHDIDDVKLRLKSIEENFVLYNQIQNRLDRISPNVNREIERTEFEDAHYQRCAMATQWINSRSIQNMSEIRNAGNVDAQIRERLAQLEANVSTQREHELAMIRELTASRNSIGSGGGVTHFPLPRLDLPSFTGVYDEWLGFRDAFTAIIHEDTAIPTIQKLRYLRSYVKGNAAKIIDSLATTENNYLVAWNLLNDRYNNERVIVQNHMQSLLDLSNENKDSPSSLRSLLDSALRHVRALDVLKQPTESWDVPLVCIIAGKLDKETRKEWEKSVAGGDVPTFEQFTKFLKTRCEILETISKETNSNNKTSNVKSNEKWQAQAGNKRVTTKAFVNNSSGIRCPVCSEDHYIQMCEKFSKLSSEEKSQIVRDRGFCYNCLRRNHMIKDCRSSGCTICGRRHHTLLHIENYQGPSNKKSNENENSIIVKTKHALDASKVLLSTAKIDMLDFSGKSHSCRILLDSGSQPNLITEEFVNRLNIEKRKFESSIEGISSQSVKSREWVDISFRSQSSSYLGRLTFMVLPQITSDLPSFPINKEILKIPKHLKLSDPQFHIPGKIDALIGGELFYELLERDRIPLSISRVSLQNTKLGWIVSGRVGVAGQSKVQCNLARDTLSDQVERFWKLEEVDNKKHKSSEEEICEKHFKDTTQRDEEGRYMVNYPFTNKLADLGSSFGAASRRFFSLERRLEKNPEIKMQYHQFMKTYLDLNHMEPISCKAEDGFFIPHQAVIREESLTTKLRVVFDASAKSSTGISLNEAMRSGPVIQDGVFSLILKFRRHPIAIGADIEKMYRQFWVHPSQRKYQQIIWRFNPHDPLTVYQLNTLTYGTAAAPFLATRCLQQLAEDEGHEFPAAAEVLCEDFYVDDMFTGRDTLEEAEELTDELISLTGKAGLKLCKWISNDSRLTQKLPDSLEKLLLNFEKEGQTSKALGVTWNAKDDTLMFEVRLKQSDDRISKRTILSQVAQLYDPLGLIAPVVICAKIQLQELWKTNLGWDDDVPEKIADSWLTIRTQLDYLNCWSIPRAVRSGPHEELQLHGFSDASEKAYGACLYLRTSTENKHRSILLCAKSRVAPLKSVTIPRLELCAALLLARLSRTVQESLKLEYSKKVFWTDSTIVLNWINTSPHELKTFVANRISEIQELTLAEDWKHVLTADNPADYVSRGQLPSEFLSNSQWKRGPTWLAQSESTWPVQQWNRIETPERKLTTLSASVKDVFELWSRYSSWNLLIRVVAVCLRVLKWRKDEQCPQGIPTVVERRAAEMRIICLVQRETFSEEINKRMKKQKIPKHSRIIRLSPILKDGVLRVGGRIEHSELNYDQTHPILLPKSHPVTTLIIRHTHEKMMHAGETGTLYELRNKYWVIDGRVEVKKVLNRCVKCYRVNPQDFSYVMGNLPKVRVTEARPFENVGVDFCGYFYIKAKRFRNKEKLKVYVAVFVCMVTKAVHLELIENLTSEAFLNGLRRFVARRGKCKNIYSDNATNFVGARNELKELHSMLYSGKSLDKLKNYCLDEEIQWHFIPPRTPHFGGVWEAAVKSFKQHLKKTVGETLFCYEDLNTLICEIEAVLNSRPLTPMSADPCDLNVLTPGHLLIGESLQAVPSLDYTDIPANRLAVWQHVQKMKLDFWRRWHAEYLNELTVKNKWHQGQSNVGLGMLVMLKDENQPPLRWSLGRIVKLYPGDDGIIRVVDVKTKNGVIKSGLKKLSPLPIET